MGVTYKVETVRSDWGGKKMDAEPVEKLLNKRASEGWRLRATVETEVKERLGSGGTLGLMLIFEKEA